MTYLKTLFVCLIILKSLSLQAAGPKIFSDRQMFPLTRSGALEDMPRETIIITIDDGPTPASSSVLDVLERYQVKATFFWQGQFLRIPSRRPIIERAYADGHIIANHTYNHELDFPVSQDFINSLMRTHQLITPYESNSSIPLFRAPGGAWNSWRAGIGNQHSVLRDYVGPIFWNAGGGAEADWSCWRDKKSPRACAEGYYRAIQANYRRSTGSLVLLHDLKVESAQMLEHLLRMLESDNIRWEYRMVDEIPAVRELAR